MKLNVPQNARYVLTSLGNVTFSRRSLFHDSHIPCPFSLPLLFKQYSYQRVVPIFIFMTIEKTMLFLRTFLTFHGFLARNNWSRGGTVFSSQTSLNYMIQAYFLWSSKELNKRVLSLGFESDVSKEAETSTLRIKLFWWMRQQVSPKRRDKCAILKVVIIKDRTRHGNRYEDHKPHENRICSFTKKKGNLREIKSSIKDISK